MPTVPVMALESGFTRGRRFKWEGFGTAHLGPGIFPREDAKVGSQRSVETRGGNDPLPQAHFLGFSLTRFHGRPAVVRRRGGRLPIFHLTASGWRASGVQLPLQVSTADSCCGSHGLEVGDGWEAWRTAGIRVGGKGGTERVMVAGRHATPTRLLPYGGWEARGGTVAGKPCEREACGCK